MVWTWESTCSACTFVSGQIAPTRPALPMRARGPVRMRLFRSTPSDSDPTVQPSADQPWPFTRQQFARLLLLRGRVRDRRQATSGDTAGPYGGHGTAGFALRPTCGPLLQGVHSLYEPA